MTHEDELRSLESTLAVYKETIKEVNRLGGDGMVSVRDRVVCCGSPSSSFNAST